MKLENLKWFWLSTAVLGFDQLTKALIRHGITLDSGVEITSYFNIVHVRNYGAAFSFLDNVGGDQRWWLAAFSLLVSVALFIWLLKLPSQLKWQACGIAVMIGGALGNFCDRFIDGHVVDFLDFHINNTHWPAFNVADSAVCIGAIILLINIFLDQQ